MKNGIRFFLTISIMLATACEKDEVIYEAAEEVTAANLNANVLNCSFAPNGVSTLTGGLGFKDGALNEALFNNPTAMVFDEHREIMYVVDSRNHAIRAIKNNKVSTFVGGVQGDSEGKGKDARLNSPKGIAIDKQGNLFVTDSNNHKIRKITPEGKMSTFAGSVFGFANGRGNNAKFTVPYGITLDDNEGVLYVTDMGNSKIRTIKSDASVGTLAGSTPGFRDSNNSSIVKFRLPRGIDIGPDGALYVADYANHRIRRVTKTGRTSTFAGSRIGSINGTLLRATFAYPNDIICDKAGNFFVIENVAHRVRIIGNNQVGTLAGGTTGNIDGNYNQARFRYPVGIAIFKDDLFVADMGNHAIRKIAMDYACN